MCSFSRRATTAPTHPPPPHPSPPHGQVARLDQRIDDIGREVVLDEAVTLRALQDEVTRVCDDPESAAIFMRHVGSQGGGAGPYRADEDCVWHRTGCARRCIDAWWEMYLESGSRVEVVER